MPGLTWVDDPLLLLLYALAVYRLTRLASADTITEPVRQAIGRLAYPPSDPLEGQQYRSGWAFLDRLIGCPWCVSVWLAAGWAALACLVPVHLLALVAFVLTASAVAGLLSARE